MKQKSDKSKLLEGRCRGQGAEYTAFITANEAHSIGTASEIYDPVVKRIVDTLSESETAFFWIQRYDDRVVQIREQMLLIPKFVEKAARELGYRVPKHILSTDFLIDYSDGSKKAFSIKSDRSVFDANAAGEKAVEALIRRQKIEEAYWKNFGIPFEIVFGEDLDRVYARNIEAVMNCYDSWKATSPDRMYRYLLAHKDVEIDLHQRNIPFSKIARENQEVIEKLFYERSRMRDD